MRTNIIGNLATFAVDGRALERVMIRSDDLVKRVLRLATSAGEIGIRFAGAQRIRDGDIVFADDRLVVAASVAAEDVLIMEPPTINAAIRIAHALGNRHLPIGTDGAVIIVRYDPLLEALAREHAVAVRREQRIISQPFRYADAPHRHD